MYGEGPYSVPGFLLSALGLIWSIIKVFSKGMEIKGLLRVKTVFTVFGLGFWAACRKVK